MLLLLTSLSFGIQSDGWWELKFVTWFSVTDPETFSTTAILVRNVGSPLCSIQVTQSWGASLVCTGTIERLHNTKWNTCVYLRFHGIMVIYRERYMREYHCCPNVLEQTRVRLTFCRLNGSRAKNWALLKAAFFWIVMWRVAFCTQPLTICTQLIAILGISSRGQSPFTS